MTKSLLKWKERFDLVKLGAEAFKAVLVDIGILIGIIGACLQGGDLVMKKLDMGIPGINMSFSSEELKAHPKLTKRNIKLEPIRVEGGGGSGAGVSIPDISAPTEEPVQLALSSRLTEPMITYRNIVFFIMMLGLFGVFFRSKLKKHRVEDIE